MKEYVSIKIFDGYSTAFRQWRATHSHCQYIHGYALKFKVWFEGELDEKNLKFLEGFYITINRPIIYYLLY